MTTGKNPGPLEIQETLSKRGWIRLEHPPEESLKLETIFKDGYLFRRDYWHSVQEDIRSRGASSDGVTLDVLSRDLGLSRGALKPLLARLQKDGRGLTLKGVFYSGQDRGLHELSPFDKANRERLREAGPAGLEAAMIKIPGILPSLQRLSEKGLAAALSETLFWDPQVLEDMRRKLMRGLRPGEIMTIDQARTRTGLSRRYLLPLFASLEEDGYLQRTEEARRVIKVYPGTERTVRVILREAPNGKGKPPRHR
jgi:selenocysteine-specific elongation factor